MALAAPVPDAMDCLNAMGQSCPRAANICHYVGLTHDRALRRASLTARGQLTDMALRPGGGFGMHVLDATQSALTALARNGCRVRVAAHKGSGTAENGGGAGA